MCNFKRNRAFFYFLTPRIAWYDFLKVMNTMNTSSIKWSIQYLSYTQMAPFFIKLCSFLAVFLLKIELSHRKNGAISDILLQMTIGHAWGIDTCLSNIRWHFLGLKFDEWLNGAVFSLYFCAEKVTFLALFDENHLKINEKFIFCMMLLRKRRHFKCNSLTHILAYSRHELIVWRHFQTLFTGWHSTKLVMAPFL